MDFKQDTFLTKELEAAQSKLQYDEHAKQILSNRYILAWILKGVAEEFKDFTTDFIAQRCIDGPITVSAIPVSPGLSNVSIPLDKIDGLNTENSLPGEGTITYDIRFCTHISNTIIPMRFYFNIEAQKYYYNSYAIPTRGIFYGARMISSQMDTEFVSPHYESLKKVYSIWLCMNAPKHIGNAASKYSIEKCNLLGDIPCDKAEYDKLSVVILCFCSSQTPQIPVEFDDDLHKLLCLLHIIFTPCLAVKQKTEILEQQFGIASKEMKGGLETMCNWSDVIEEMALEKGREQGLNFAISTFIPILRSFGISDDMIIQNLVDNFKMTEENAKAALAGS